MAGYRRANKTHTLTPSQYEGLEVVMKGLNTDQMMTVWLKETKDLASIQIEMFANCLISWNLEDENGNPVPATMEGVKSEDFSFIMELVGEWTTAISGVSDELGKGSTSGSISPEVVIPMEVS